MNKRILGFTLAELLVAISILIIVTGLTIPVAKKILPDSDKEMIKRVYYQLGAITRSMTSDPYVYPTGRFDKPRDYVNKQNGMTYNKQEKFTKVFASKLNIIKIITNTKKTDWDNVLSYIDSNSLIPNNAFEDKQSVCIITNNKINYCLPKVTYIDSHASTDCMAYDRFCEDKTMGYNGNVIIKVYLSDDHSIENGYYFTISKDGKIGLLPTDNITSLIPAHKLAEFKC